ncbi:hypothetical protein BBG48_001095 [Criibacterium bergeronii]|uniref:Uncharacterized protein n=1 Tax=Criibacterium bergeronii TaxID=1871336 RepID=A0A371IPD0_9FIRM|nr:hypothetical protein BBG48_001095 [Criibacterium bergeronii]
MSDLVITNEKGERIKADETMIAIMAALVKNIRHNIFKKMVMSILLMLSLMQIGKTHAICIIMTQTKSLIKLPNGIILSL